MILVFGRTGQVARALQEELGRRPLNAEIRFLGRDEADFEKPELVTKAVEAFKPSLVINTVAYTAVDRAESEPEKAYRVNAKTVAELARLCALREIPLIHYSSDYVYDGAGDEPRMEDAPVNPLNAYGRSKAEGDRAILESKAKALIFRTSWVYYHDGQNFVRTMLRLGSAREELSVVADQIGSPTSATAIARATLTIAQRVLGGEVSDWGVFHMAGKGFTSWHGFATEIFRQARELGMPLAVREVRPIPTKDYPTPARRPLNSRLDQAKLRKTFGIELPDWEDSLRECLSVICSREVALAGGGQ